MRNVHPYKRPILETVNSKVEGQLIGRGVLFEPLHPPIRRRARRIRITPRRVLKTWKRELRVHAFKNASSSP